MIASLGTRMDDRQSHEKCWLELYIERDQARKE
jgi:hypothetical protein